MPPKFTEIAFTSAVKAMQERYGSRQMYERLEARGPDNNTLTPSIAEFIQQRDSFHSGTVNAKGWPYIQFRGEPVGFLRVVDETTLGFADFSGNCQYLNIGNLVDSDRVDSSDNVVIRENYEIKQAKQRLRIFSKLINP